MYLKSLVHQVDSVRDLHVYNGSADHLSQWEHKPRLLVIHSGSRDELPWSVIHNWSGVPKVIISRKENHAKTTGEVYFLPTPLDVRGFVKCIHRLICPSDEGYHDSDSFPCGPYLIGNNPKMRELRHKIARLSRSGLSVLICGQTGTGKGVAALSLHNNSPQKNHRFLSINCANVPNNLLESELFGYRKGAFTGAWQDKPGMFEQAGQGTVFLDEISEMSPYMQAKLLHVLQEKEFYPVGGTARVQINARMIAATNADLRNAMLEGGFREDLYYRLAVVRLDLPPLKQRKGDITLLAQYFLDKFCLEYGKPDFHGPSRELWTLLEEYEWPGNVRELESFINGLVALESEEMVMEELYRKMPSCSVSPGMHQGGPEKRADASGCDFLPLKEIANKAAGQAEADIIRRTLERTGGRKKLAAAALKVSYKSLLKKIKSYGL